MVPAGSGRQAIELAASLRLDLLILDDEGDVDAGILCRFLHDIDRLADVPAILIDGVAPCGDDPPHFPSLYLRKPFDLEEFGTALHTVLSAAGRAESS